MSEARRKRVAVLISGRGSNLRALVEAARAPDYPAEIALVLSSRHDAAGLEFARTAGIAAIAVASRDHPDQAAREAAMQAALEEYRIDLICLAGYMRILSPEFVHRWQGRIINVHPSLLPEFKGLDTHARVLAAGRAVHGATVHFVTAEMDDGPIILQEEVPVLPGDTPESLAARVLAAEHRIYPQALRLVAAGQASMPRLTAQ